MHAGSVGNYLRNHHICPHVPACASRYKKPAGSHSRTLFLSSRRAAISVGAKAGLNVGGFLKLRGAFVKFSPLREI